MKNLFLVVAVVSMFSLNACGQASKDVPDKVKTAFSQKFPTATKVKWDKENETEWEAEFKMNGIEYSANYGADGSWNETEYEIEAKDLPEAVKSALKTEFAKYEIGESEVTETVEGTFYEIQLKDGKNKMEAVVDASGKLVKKEGNKEEEEDEEEDDD